MAYRLTSCFTWAVVPVLLGIMLFSLSGCERYSDMLFKCQPHSYSIEILSIDPFIMYINDFLSDAEILHILAFSHEHSEETGKLVSDLGSSSVNERSLRFSWRDQLNMCLSERMKALLGNIQHIETEPVRVVKYVDEEKLEVHYDWFPNTRSETGYPDMPARPNNRLGSIFAYIEDDCDGGETYFPDVKGVDESADGSKFSRSENGHGLLVKPRRGNAIFWNNLHPNGTGDPRTAHAGMPVTRGRKIGINIWSFYFLDSPVLG